MTDPLQINMPNIESSAIPALSSSIDGKFTIDEPNDSVPASDTPDNIDIARQDLPASTAEHVDPSADASHSNSDPTDRATFSKGRGRGKPHEHRQQKPSNVLFLPNMSYDAYEKDLAEFATKLPCKSRKTFMYMSDAAHHGFVECETVEDASRNLEWINAATVEVKGKRIVAEFSRRQNVEDRRTYEQRQSARKTQERGPRGGSSRRYDDHPPRRRSRSPPRGSYRQRSPPRDREYDRYPPRDYRDDHYRREPMDSYANYPPPSRYDAHPSGGYRREYDDYPRGPPASYRPEHPSYDAPHYPPPSRGYPPRDEYPAYPPAAHYAPRSPMREEMPYPPNPAYASRDPYHQAGRDPYQTAPVREAYPSAGDPYESARPSHPLLSLQNPVRPTAVGTRAQGPPPSYQPYQYK